MADLNCLKCASKNLVAEVTMRGYYPLAARHGSIKVGQKVITQLEVKSAWDTKDGSPRELKGPIVCLDCEHRHTYVVSEACLIDHTG